MVSRRVVLRSISGADTLSVWIHIIISYIVHPPTIISIVSLSLVFRVIYSCAVWQDWGRDLQMTQDLMWVWSYDVWMAQDMVWEWHHYGSRNATMDHRDNIILITHQHCGKPYTTSFMQQSGKSLWVIHYGRTPQPSPHGVHIHYLLQQTGMLHGVYWEVG